MLPNLEGIAVDIAAGLERMALDGDISIRPRAAAASRLLELSGVDPGDVPALPCDPLPDGCKRMKAKYCRLRDWSARGYLLIPTPWGRDLKRVRWRERSCVEAVVLAQLLRAGLRGDALADIICRTRRTPTVTLEALASEPDGVDKLFDSAAVGV